MIQSWCLSQQLMEINSNMASLELDEKSENISTADTLVQPKKNLRRSSRIKSKVNLSFAEPQTRNKKSGKCKTVEQYYLSTEVKRLPSTLETIYEEPKSSNSEIQYMSVKRFKRILSFDEECSVVYKNKRSRKRLMKAKKITAANRISIRKKISMETLLRKLETIEEETGILRNTKEEI